MGNRARHVARAGPAGRPRRAAGGLLPAVLILALAGAAGQQEGLDEGGCGCVVFPVGGQFPQYLVPLGVELVFVRSDVREQVALERSTAVSGAPRSFIVSNIR
ncbi:hypothetical protein GCM10010276_87240 [Streptomyces longisporus]|uniref:Uncharacterized protein n=1 Tax=Streptomyces longisporus TaxID=1948 RepID=A0ABN3NHY0_STRLO